MKTPREIGHDATIEADSEACTGFDMVDGKYHSDECNTAEEAAKRGMIEALRWAVNEADPDEVEAKLVELEKS